MIKLASIYMIILILTSITAIFNSNIIMDDVNSNSDADKINISYNIPIGPNHFSYFTWITQDHADYYSPDHKYIARFYSDYGDENHRYKNPWMNLKIIHVIKLKNKKSYETVINGNIISDIVNCVWLSGYPHVLIIATSSIYGTQASLAIWNGETGKIYYLMKGTLNGVETYKIYRAYKNGLLLYHYINYYKADQQKINYENKRILKIHMPKDYLKKIN